MTSEIRVNKLTNRIGLSTVTFADSGIGVTVTGRIDPDTDSARDLGTTSVRWRNAYVDTYYGDGSNLTGITGTTINNNANYRIISGDANANELNAEPNLTFTGSNLTVTNSSGASELTLTTPNNTDGGVYFRTGNTNAGAVTYLHTDNSMKFRVNSTNKMIIDSSGRVGINKTPALASSKLEVGGADNYPLINVEASGATAGMGIGGGALQFFYGTSEKVRITSDGYIRLGNIGHSSSKVGGQNVTGQDYDPYFKLYSSTNNHWLMQLRSDTGTGGNGIFVRSGNSSSTYTLYATGYDENNAHFLVRGDGVCSIGAKYTQGGANPQLSLYGSSGRQFKIMNSGTQTTSIQLQNSTTGYGEDAGIHMALLSTGTGYLTNQYAGNYAWEIYQKQSGGSHKHIMRVYRDGKIGQQTDTDNLMLSNSQDGSGSNYFLRGSKNSTTPGGGNDVVWIYEDGDIRNNNNSYGQQSDIKLKENVVDANSQWDDIKNIKVRNFNFKASTGFDTHTQIGLIAQEAELVSPGLVKEVKDRVKTEEISEVDGSKSYNESLSETEKTKHVMYSVLYMKAIKALQEAMTRIETLEQDNIALRARVTNLEGN